jgi:CBS domain-containing protein
MQVKEVMDKKFPKLYAEESLDKAISILVKIPETALPVVDKKGKVIGEIDQHELLLLDIGKEKFEEEGFSLDKIKFLFNKKAKKVKDVMQKHEITLFPDANIIEAAKLMYDEDISTIPVVDKNDKLLGIITEVGILKHYKKILNRGKK